MFSSEVPPEPTPAPTPVSGDFWAGIVDYWVTNWDDVLGNLISIVFIIAIALLIRWVLHFVIERVVKQVVTGVKKKQDVTDTQALQASPHRSRRCGSCSARARSGRCSRTSST